MLTLTENTERKPMPYCTHEKAARLLEELRALYQTLSFEERGQVKSHFTELARVQSITEGMR